MQQPKLSIKNTLYISFKKTIKLIKPLLIGTVFLFLRKLSLYESASRQHHIRS